MNSVLLSDEQTPVSGEQASGEHPDYPHASLLCRILLMISVIALPFVVAGTVDLGFALKIYEVANALLFLTCLTIWAITRRPQLVFKPEERWVIGLACAYFIAAMVSSANGYVILNDYRNQIDIASWREDPMIASLLKCGYLFFDIFGFAYVVGIKGIPVEKICNWWLIGGVLAAIYGWYLFIFSVTGHTPVLLPGQVRLQAGAPFLPQAVRCGTFLEGNHVSMYYLTSAAVGFIMLCRTWKFRYALLGFFFLFSMAHTLSTIGIISSAAFLIFGFTLIAFSSRTGIAFAIPVLWIMILAATLLVASPFFENVVVEKFSNDRASMDNSRLQREDGIMAGFDMFKEHPIFGIGLSNFGYLYPYYTAFAPSTDAGRPADLKVIPNNIYAEVSTETGIVGSVIFFSFCVYLVRLYRKSSRGLAPKVALSGLIGIFVAWLAYPTFSILFQWIFFALAVRLFLETEDPA